MNMLLILGLLAVSMQVKPSLLANSDFREGLSGWRYEGDARASEGKVLLGPGQAAIRQTYPIPGLHIVFCSAHLEGDAVLKYECFDQKNRLLHRLTGKPDEKHVAAIYTKTQAHSAYVVISIEKPGVGASASASEVLFTDDDKARIPHEPEIDLGTMMEPFWAGDQVTDESVLLLSEHGGAPSGRLLYAPSEVSSVRDSSLKQSFKLGTDFEIAGRRIVALPGSSIPTMRDSELATGAYPWTELQGRHVFVTYRHTEKWSGPVPACQGDRLSKTVNRLTARKPLKIVAFGDSITLGINVSGFRGVPPYLPPWPTLVESELRRRYQNPKITMVNVGLGGMTSSWAKENAQALVATLDPDLVLIGFGMNDFWSLAPAEFGQNIGSVIQTVRARRPNCEFVLIASMQFDPAYTAEAIYLDHLAGYTQELRKLAGPGVALFDMASLSDALYKVKSQKDLATDPMHPDDFLARIYAQGIVATLSKN